MKKNIAKNIFIWSMIVLFAVASGCFIAELYFDFHNESCVSAETTENEIDYSNWSDFENSQLSLYVPVVNDNKYFNYSLLHGIVLTQTNFRFNLRDFSMFVDGPTNNTQPNYGFQYIFVNNDTLSGTQSATILAGLGNRFTGFNLSTLTSGLTLVNSSTLYLWKWSSGNSYTANSTYNSKCYTLTYGATDYMTSICGYTTGIVTLSSSSVTETGFKNLSFSAIDNHTYFVLSLFDINYNRFTLLIDTNTSKFSSGANFSGIYYPLQEYFFSSGISGGSSQDGNWYNRGYNAGFKNGKNEGYNNGYDTGYDVGYDVGHNQGIIDSNEYSFLGLIGAVVDAPIAAFTGLFNFSILGVNLKDFLAGLLTICIVIVVVRLILVK